MVRPEARLVGSLRQLFGELAPTEVPDERLLERFAAMRDEEAFAALVRRHGPLVLGVCRRLLPSSHDAEDVFQATFLALARQARALREQRALAGWLHSVARRLAGKLRHAESRRAGLAECVPVRESLTPDPLAEVTGRELLAALDEALAGVPEKYRLPVVLCYLEGKTQDEAARQLAWPRGTLKARLERGRELLHRTLSRRGFTLSLALLPAALAQHAAAALPAGLHARTIAAALAPASAPCRAVALARMALETPRLGRAVLAAVMLGLGALGVGLAARPAAPPVPPGPPAAAREAARGQRDTHGDPLPAGAVLRLGTVRLRHLRDVHTVAFDQGGKVLLSSGDDDVLRFWDAATGRPLRRLADQPGEIRTFALSPDGKVLATPDRRGISLWDRTRMQRLRTLPRKGWTHALLFSPDGKTLASGDGDAHVRLWDVGAGRLLFDLPGHQTPGQARHNVVRGLAFSRDGKLLASCGSGKAPGGGTVKVWETATGRLVAALPSGDRELRGVAFTPNGKVLLSAGDRTLRWWNLDRRLQVRHAQVMPSLGEIVALALSPDGKTAATGTMAKAVHLWDASSGKMVRQLSGFRDPFTAWYNLAFSPDGKQLASGGNGRAVHVWDVKTGDRLPRGLESQDGEIYSLALSRDGRTLASGSNDGTVWLWDLARGRKLRALADRHPSTLVRVALSPDGRLVASGAGDPGVRLHDLATGKLLRTFPTGKFPAGQVLGLAFSPDGKLLAGAINDGKSGEGNTIRLWETASGKVVCEVPSVSIWVSSLAFAADGKSFYVAGTGLKHFSALTGKELGGFPKGRIADGFHVPFTPDGRWAATALQNTARLWDLKRGKIVATFRGATDGWLKLALSPDGRYLAGCSMGVRALGDERDRMIQVWELLSGQEVLRRTRAADAQVSAAVLTADASKLITGMTDTSILVWAIARAEPRVLQPQELEQRWGDLAGPAPQAHAAVWALVGSPAQAVRLLRTRLKRVAGVEERRVKRLIAELGSEDFTTRTRATEELGRLGGLARAALESARQGERDLERARRIDRLLEQMDRPPHSPEQLRILRGIEVLERIGSAGAREALTALARGAPGARTTREASAALARLGGS
jgi:RNA polymerase sigma factor (sigma-70 family)